MKRRIKPQATQSLTSDFDRVVVAAGGRLALGRVDERMVLGQRGRVPIAVAAVLIAAVLGGRVAVVSAAAVSISIVDMDLVFHPE